MKRAEKNSEQNIKGYHKLMLGIMFSFVTVCIVMLILVYRQYMKRFNFDSSYNTYKEYYVMISNNRKSSLIQNIYQGAKETGIEQGIYVDLLGDNLTNDYTEEDLMKIAISSEVDGIIVDADESEEMKELIDRAANDGIPVVTLINDNTQSSRCSFVGIGGFEIGREYGNQINQIVKELRKQYFMSTEYAMEQDIATVDVAVLVNSTSNSASQNLILSGISEAVENRSEEIGTAANLKIIAVDNSNTFSVEESIRDIFIDKELPAVIVCLDEITTTCVYQAVVDYNIVGKVDILGYYDSDTIINAINRGVINSTISVDAQRLGYYCVNALKDYNDLGTTSQYYTGDITLIDRRNVSEYLKKEEQSYE